MMEVLIVVDDLMQDEGAMPEAEGATRTVTVWADIPVMGIPGQETLPSGCG